MKIVLIAFILTYRSQHCTSETIFCGVMFYSALLRPLCHLTISSQVDQLPCEVTACLHSSECGVIRWGFVSDHGWRWETFSMLRECEGPSGWLSSHSYSPSLLGDWQAIVIVSRWKRPYLKGPSPVTIPPNGIKVAQCTLLLHQRALPVSR